MHFAFGVPVHSGTAPFSAAPYTCNMPLESIEATVVTVRASAVCTAGGTRMTNQAAVIPVVDPEIRWRDWQARGAARDRRTATRVRILLLLIVAALAVWFVVQLA
jgi:hypothetical protein